MFYEMWTPPHRGGISEISIRRRKRCTYNKHITPLNAINFKNSFFHFAFLVKETEKTIQKENEKWSNAPKRKSEKSAFFRLVLLLFKSILRVCMYVSVCAIHVYVCTKSREQQQLNLCARVAIDFFLLINGRLLVTISNSSSG